MTAFALAAISMACVLGAGSVGERTLDAVGGLSIILIYVTAAMAPFAMIDITIVRPCLDDVLAWPVLLGVEFFLLLGTLLTERRSGLYFAPVAERLAILGQVVSEAALFFLTYSALGAVIDAWLGRGADSSAQQH